MTLKNRIITCALAINLALSPLELYAFKLPYFGKKSEPKKQEQVDPTIREKTIKYLEKKGGVALPRIEIPEVIQDDSTLTAPMYKIAKILEPYIDEQNKEDIIDEVRNAEIEFSRNRQELTGIVNSDTLTADGYNTYSTPRTNIYPDETLTLLNESYQKVAEAASQGDSTATTLMEQLRPEFDALEKRARIMNAVRYTLDQVVSKTEKKANSGWYESPWFYVPTGVGLAIAGYFAGKKIAGGKGAEPQSGGIVGGTAVKTGVY